MAARRQDQQGKNRKDREGLAVLAVLTGVVAAITLVSMRGQLAERGMVRSVELVGVSSALRSRQIQVAAAGHARGVQMRAVRFSMLEGEEGEVDQADDVGNVTSFTECNSWRGCYMMREQYDINGTTEILPEQVQFECGGAASTEICYNATMECLDSAESFSAMLYKVSPYEGSEQRTKSTCKCFGSNGCRPSCNVVLYQRWSSNTGINCPADPPIFHAESGVYQYGDTSATYVAPNDYSFDYYPEYPNPAGHVYDSPWSRNTYEAEPGIGMYQSPLTANYGGDDGAFWHACLFLSTLNCHHSGFSSLWLRETNNMHHSGFAFELCLITMAFPLSFACRPFSRPCTLFSFHIPILSEKFLPSSPIDLCGSARRFKLPRPGVGQPKPVWNQRC